jgi:malate dehydrogenase (oxaloacetate-decarboxylating)
MGNEQMLDFNFQNDTIVTSLTGKLLMNTPLLNKGTAFTAEERRAFGLLGKLPARVETLDEQVARAYEQYKRYTVDLSQHIYLYNLHERNEVLFYKLVSDHLEEMMPIIYTPIIGNAVKQYSREFRAPRGLFVAYPDRDDMDVMIANRTHPDIDLIVATDGSGVLGIGDQGIGGMDIPVAKLMVYTLCAGINPGKTLPVMLDVGTDNQTLLNDPLYLGWRHERLRGQAYDDFIDRFVKSVAKQFPHSFLHWEDFGRDAAHSVLERYKEEHSSFNDDIQGTGVVCLAAILAALKATKQTIADQRIVIYGAGAAGVGIADQIAAALIRSGMPEREARAKFWLLNSQGLIMEGKEVKSFQRPYMRTAAEV